VASEGAPVQTEGNHRQGNRVNRAASPCARQSNVSHGGRWGTKPRRAPRRNSMRSARSA